MCRSLTKLLYRTKIMEESLLTLGQWIQSNEAQVASTSINRPGEGLSAGNLVIDHTAPRQLHTSAPGHLLQCPASALLPLHSPGFTLTSACLAHSSHRGPTCSQQNIPNEEMVFFVCLFFVLHRESKDQQGIWFSKYSTLRHLSVICIIFYLIIFLRWTHLVNVSLFCKQQNP